MKRFLKSKNIMIFVGLLIAIVVFVLSFLTQAIFSGENEIHFKNVIWGCTSCTRINDGRVMLCEMNPVYLSVIGTILVLVCGMLSFVAIFIDELYLNKKTKFITTLVCGSLMAVGGVFLFFTLEGFYVAYMENESMSVDFLRDYINYYNIKTSCPLSIVSGVLSIVGGTLVIASQFIDKELK